MLRNEVDKIGDDIFTRREDNIIEVWNQRPHSLGTQVFNLIWCQFTHDSTPSQFFLLKDALVRPLCW